MFRVVRWSGSSPHTRRTRALSPSIVMRHRFIPAHAENTGCARQRRRFVAVHPRTRGEHEKSLAENSARLGSSPHTRRTLAAFWFWRRFRRFIPAHAENTFSRPFAPLPVSVHPRTRGEHAPARAGERARHGSSPHTRRTRKPDAPPTNKLRFIPAHAENTFARFRMGERTAVHPRTRGEHIGRIYE